MTEPVFPEGILSLERSADVPLAEQIYRGFRDAVRTGLLRSGTKLPSTRRLAASLNVGRNTVNTAYDLLQAEGVITVRTGAAPRITEGLVLEGVQAQRKVEAFGLKLSQRGRTLSANLRGEGWAYRQGGLQPGAPALDLFPYEEWARSLRRAARLERSADLHYQNFAGLEVLKRQIARHLAAERGVRADPHRTCGAVILEDDYDSEFLFEGRPVAALHGLADEGQVVYMGTFAKSLLPGLRIAYCVVPDVLVAPLTQTMRNIGCSANVQAQAALAYFMDCGAYQKHLKQIRPVYLERGTMLAGALRQRLGNRVEVAPLTGNVQLTVMFREPVNDIALAVAMQDRGFAVSPLSNCYLGEGGRPGLIVGFAGANARQIEEGVDTLAGLLGTGHAY